MATYTLSHQAYLKILLHAAKYPHAPVNGVLVGRKDGSGSSVSVVIVDVIPLLHVWTTLSPMMEIGLDLAGVHSESVGLQLVGYYQAAERADDTTLSPVGERVASKVKDIFQDAVALVVDGRKVGSGESPLLPYTSSGTTWRLHPSPGSIFQLTNPASPKRALTLIRDEEWHQRLGDFDDHLEDVTIDWLKNAACTDTSFS